MVRPKKNILGASQDLLQTQTCSSLRPANGTLRPIQAARGPLRPTECPLGPKGALLNLKKTLSGQLMNISGHRRDILC